TFTADVAPILYESCASCHNPNGIAPMSLLNYDEVRPWAALISLKVKAREMPPWHLDQTTGIQEYKNDISLSDEQIATIVAWAESGALEGDPSALPALPELRTGADWQMAELLGPPDFVVKSPPYTIAANAQDQWWVRNTTFEGLIDGPRYVRATELKGSYPQGVKVLHHAHAQLTSLDETGRRTGGPIGRQGVGKGGDLFPEGTGMLIQSTGSINWNLHYFPIDVVVQNEQAEAAVWLYPEGYRPEFETRGEQFFAADTGPGGLWANDIMLPPNSIKSQQGVRVLDRPAMITSFRPHLHMRGKAQSLEAVYPDGRREMLARVDKYVHTWQIAYEFEDDAAPLLPKGTVLMITSTWDNTADNPNNPDPRQFVIFGQRGVDEMSHLWLGITYLTDDQFERLSAERRRNLTAQNGR
ncbi:MAG TPA: cytochrome c, partial [Gammaproteobacteria bacterium]|nr:cytochrome c [Gammaproteobacteria bacterium]